MKQKTFYYTDELNDDFAGFNRKKVDIDQTYKYQRNIFWNITAYIIYPFVRLFGYLYLKLRFHLRIINRKAIKAYQKEGYFLYANHTQAPGDGFLPALVCYPKHVHILVSSENISLKGTKNVLAMLGATPIPNKMSGMKNFKQYLHYVLTKRDVIMIYPEAHIWPYYTKIRPFPSTSFTYPVIEDKKAFCFTVTYQKRKHRTQMTCYVDGPFFPKKEDDKKQRIEALRNQVYEVMKNRSRNSSYEKIKYIKKESEKIC